MRAGLFDCRQVPRRAGDENGVSLRLVSLLPTRLTFGQPGKQPPPGRVNTLSPVDQHRPFLSTGQENVAGLELGHKKGAVAAGCSPRLCGGALNLGNCNRRPLGLILLPFFF